MRTGFGVGFFLPILQPLPPACSPSPTSLLCGLSYWAGWYSGSSVTLFSGGVLDICKKVFLMAF